MNDRIIAKLPTVTISLFGIVLLGFNWYLAPEKAELWGLLVLAVLIALVGLVFIRFRVGQDHPIHSITSASMFASAVILVASLSSIAAGELGFVSSGLEKRIIGIILSVMLIVTGNYLPKFVRPINAPNADTVGTRAAERYAGWCFVIAGFIGLIVWVVLDTDYAKLTFAVCGLAACALVVLRWASLSNHLSHKGSKS